MRTKGLLTLTIGIVFLTALFVGNVSAQPNIGKVAATTVTLTASNSTPAVGQSVTFTATLKSGNKPLPAEPVTIYHYANGVRYDDVTNTNTDAKGQVTATASFGYTGWRIYCATFGGDSSYSAVNSSIVAINVR
jgi:hypothetical protein